MLSVVPNDSREISSGFEARIILTKEQGSDIFVGFRAILMHKPKTEVAH